MTCHILKSLPISFFPALVHSLPRSSRPTALVVQQQPTPSIHIHAGTRRPIYSRSFSSGWLPWSSKPTEDRDSMAPPKDYDSIPAFHKKLLESKRIMAVCGAGLSAASGLPTFRGAGGLWRNHNATDLATPAAFDDDPGLVWLFYAYV